LALSQFIHLYSGAISSKESRETDSLQLINFLVKAQKELFEISIQEEFEAKRGEQAMADSFILE